MEADKSHGSTSHGTDPSQPPGIGPDHTPRKDIKDDCSIWLYFLTVRLHPATGLSSEQSATLQDARRATPDGAPIAVTRGMSPQRWLSIG